MRIFGVLLDSWTSPWALGLIPWAFVEKIGRDDWIRTSDPLTPSQVRYQAAPHPETVRKR